MWALAGRVRFVDTAHHVEERTVAFSDTDAAGVVHFSALLRYAEDAEHRFLARHGLVVFRREGGKVTGWPRVDVRFRFLIPVRFGDELTLAVELTQVGQSSLVLHHRMTCRDRLVAEGDMVSVQAEMTPEGPGESIPLPDALRARLANLLSPGAP